MSPLLSGVLLVSFAFLVLQVWAWQRARSENARTFSEWLASRDDGRRAQQTRESALLDLERSLSSCWYAAILRRSGVVAPLLGVTLTAIGFIAGSDAMSSLASVGREPSSIAGELAPLFYGVTGGAVLAIASQVLLAMLAKHDEWLIRLALAPEDLDKFHRPESSFEQYVDGLRAATTELSASTVQLREMMAGAVDGYRQVSESSNTFARQLSSTSESLTGEVATAADHFANVWTQFEAATTSAMGAVEKLSKRATDRAARVEAALVALEGIHREAADARLEAAQKEVAAIESVGTTVGQVRIAAEAIPALLRAVDETLDQHRVDHASTLTEASTEFRNSLLSLATQLRSEVESAASAMASGMASLTQQLQDSATRLDGQLMRSEQVSRAQGESLSQLTRAADSLGSVARTLDAVGKTRSWWQRAKAVDEV